MAKYHINPETGNASKCGATFKCPFGDLDRDHYATAAEARKAFEVQMANEQKAADAVAQAKSAKRLGAPIIFTEPKLYDPSRDLRYALDYDYDTYYDHPDDEDICRCGVITNVEISGWRDHGEGLAEYAKEKLGLPRNAALPESLRKELQPFVDNFNDYEFEPEISGDYYGEVLDGITGPSQLTRILDDFYYSQPDAAGPDNILSYLRGKGYETKGERPLEAIKGSLQAENNGKISQKVEKAKKWRTGELNLSSITAPSASQIKAGENDPRELKSPYPGRQKPGDGIAGVVLQRADGSYELIDGYHRLAWLKDKNKKRSQYIILSHERYQEPSRYSWLRTDPYVWNKE